MKKSIRHTALGIIVAVVVLCALPLLVYLPPVQNWLVQKVTAIASEQTGLDITVEHVDLDFPLDLGVDKVMVMQDGDTIANIDRTVIDIRLLPLLQGEVVVDNLEIKKASINTLSLIEDLQVKGALGLLKLDPTHIQLAHGNVNLSRAVMDHADLTVLLSDTAAVDTTDSGPTLWRIGFDQLDINHSKVKIHMPGDSMIIGVGAEQMQASHGDINLEKERYAVEHFTWKGGSLQYDLPFETYQAAGLLDYQHLNIDQIDWAVDSILFQQFSNADAPQTFLAKMNVAHTALREACGLAVNELKGSISMDNHAITLPDMVLRTPYSNIYTKAQVDFNVADSLNPGQMDITLDARMGKQDAAFFYAYDYQTLPDWPIQLSGRMRGNMEEAQLDRFNVIWPTVIESNIDGKLKHLTDMDRLQAQLDVYVRTYQLQSVVGSSAVPSGIVLFGNVQADGPRYTADIDGRLDDGRLSLKGFFDRKVMAYDADIDINDLDLNRILPNNGLSHLTSRITMRGAGFDFFKNTAWCNANASITHLGYNRMNIDDVNLQANLKNGKAIVELMSCNKVMDGNISLDATFSQPSTVRAHLSTALSHLDLHALNVTDKPLSMGLSGDFAMDSNLKNHHQLDGNIEHIYLHDSLHTYRPERADFHIMATNDTTYAHVESGSLAIQLDAAGSYEQLMKRCMVLGDSIASQINRRVIDQMAIKQLLPQARLYISSGQNNTAANFLKATANVDFKELLVDVTTSPTAGVNGQAHIFSMNADSMRIDTIYVTLKDKPNHGLTFQSRIANNRRNPQFVFTALIDGLLQEHGASMGLRFYDDRNQLGLRLGAKVEMEAEGLRFHFMPERPTIGYREFTLNEDNYLFIHNNLRLKAKVNLLADDGTGIRIYSEDQDPSLLQDLTVSLNRFDLGKLTAAIPYVPHITGLLDGDYHLTMDDKKQISVASDMQIARMTYEGSPMGDISTEFVYLQREDETHAVEGTLMQNNREVATFSGNYRNKKVTDGNEHIDGTLTLMRAPLDLMNGFIPDHLLGFEGFAEGDMSVEGSLSSPNVNGEIYLDSAFLISKPYGIRLRFDNDPVRIQQSKLLLENFTMYAYNDNPLNIMGYIDFRDLNRMSMDLRMRASNYQLINAKQTAGSIAFGKAFVNFFALMSGPMDHLKMRGRLDVLGTTDLTYLLLDSPLSTDNQLDELVKFTDFSDTTQTVVHRPTPGGLDMDLRISIDQGAHVKCGLNAEQSNYVDLYGGGDLRMVYNNNDNMRFTGRYTLTSGEMKYSLPVIPLKTFQIEDGSYVEFTGDVMNPTLHIRATERTNASVGQEGEQSRSVAFDCGVSITKTLNDMGLEFIIEAPEDYTVNSELAAMSTEQRGKIAVTMLTTGMYLADGNTSGFSMNSALSSFLESEINNITGNALKTVDLSIGLDNTTDATGQSHTDYSFKFAKRFWNNRLKVQIGGKVSSGSEMQGQKQSFFDNVAMEYRLSPTSNQYVKLFYNQNVYDWLEGYTGEYGGGYVWKRKMDSLSDIFRFNTKQPVYPTPTGRPLLKSDSIGTKSTPQP